MTIAVDLDEVVLNYIDPFLDMVNLMMGTKYTRSMMTTYSFEGCGFIPKGTNHAWTRLFAKSGYLKLLPPVPGAVQGIMNLLMAGHKIVFVTSRDTDFEKDTRAALEELGFEYLPLFFSTRDRTKADIIKLIGADILIDDSPRFVTEVATQTEANTILLSSIPASIAEAPYWRHATNWDEVYTYITQLHESREKYKNEKARE